MRSRQGSIRNKDDSLGIISACAEQTSTPKTRNYAGWDHLRVCGADFLLQNGLQRESGSSPRVRSRPGVVRTHGCLRGIISACAEQTWCRNPRRSTTGDHLRVCGADFESSSGLELTLGSSPRVRSRPPANALPRLGRGIISACAEQTLVGDVVVAHCGDHLRVCGADFRIVRLVGFDGGSSPRVRSRPMIQRIAVKHIGIISACAEQTSAESLTNSSGTDHLRVCGADAVVSHGSIGVPGSSPRVRSRPSSPRCSAPNRGIISACAEQTRWRRPTKRLTWDHLRVCGADPPPSWRCSPPRGSSPRVRSRRHVLSSVDGIGGIISACAEQTKPTPTQAAQPGDHLRVCGADTPARRSASSKLGSSPRVRSRPFLEAAFTGRVGIISACAEQTVVFYCGLGWSGVAEYLIHALRGVGKRRGCQYLE